jgi:hypothetical protein
MIDLIRESAVPANLMRTAARGALSLPPSEMLEILVCLSKHAIFGQQAQLTLAGWDAASALAVVSDPQSPPDVLDYFSAPRNHRPELLPALLENPAVSEARLVQMAQTDSRELLTLMLASPRVRSLPRVMAALQRHPELQEPEAVALGKELRSTGFAAGDILEPELSEYLHEHAAEILAEEGKPFQLVDPTTEEQAELAAALAAKPGSTGLAAHALASAARTESRERIAPVQKIARMTVGERVQLALKGSRDERFILVRDGVRVVSNAVLESPKLGDNEVEMFASMKNVSESVLRCIASKRKFMRNYPIKRLLTANPRCPLEVAMPLVKELLVADLKNLMINKNVSDIIRRFAFKMWKEKTAARNR